MNPRVALEHCVLPEIQAGDKNAVTLKMHWSVAPKTFRSIPQPLYRLFAQFVIFSAKVDQCPGRTGI